MEASLHSLGAPVVGVSSTDTGSRSSFRRSRFGPAASSPNATCTWRRALADSRAHHGDGSRGRLVLSQKNLMRAPDPRARRPISADALGRARARPGPDPDPPAGPDVGRGCMKPGWLDPGCRRLLRGALPGHRARARGGAWQAVPRAHGRRWVFRWYPASSWDT